MGGVAGEGEEDKMRGWGLRKKIEGGYAGEGKEDKMRGGGVVATRNWGGGGMPERVKKMKCEGGMREQFEGGGYAVEGTEDKMQGGCCGKNWGGMPEMVEKTKCGGGGRVKIGGGVDHTENLGVGSLLKYVFFGGGGKY